MTSETQKTKRRKVLHRFYFWNKGALGISRPIIKKSYQVELDAKLKVHKKSDRIKSNSAQHKDGPQNLPFGLPTREKKENRIEK